MFRKAGRPRFKSFRRGLNSIEGTNNQEIMYKPERGAIVWRKHVMPYMKPDTDYMKAVSYTHLTLPTILLV